MTKIQNNLLIQLKSAKTSTECSLYLELFYNETSPLVFSFCRKKALSQETTEDIVQIVYTQIFKKRHLYKSEHSPLAWLFVITKSETKDYLRSEKTYKNYVSDFSDFVLHLNAQSDFQPDLMSQIPNDNPSTLKGIDLSNLSESEKRALHLRYLEDQDFEAIAEDLKTSPMNVRKIVSRGLQKLRKGLL